MLQMQIPRDSASDMSAMANKGPPTSGSPLSTDEVKHSSAHKFFLLSHKDTDNLALMSARQMLPLDFPPITTADLCSIKVDADMLDVLREHDVNDASDTRASRSDDAEPSSPPKLFVIVRLLGRGVPGFQHLLDGVQRHDHHLVVISGIPGSFEPDLTAMCNNVSVDTINQVRIGQ